MTTKLLLYLSIIGCLCLFLCLLWLINRILNKFLLKVTPKQVYEAQKEYLKLLGYPVQQKNAEMPPSKKNELIILFKDGPDGVGGALYNQLKGLEPTLVNSFQKLGNIIYVKDLDAVNSLVPQLAEELNNLENNASQSLNAVSENHFTFFNPTGGGTGSSIGIRPDGGIGGGTGSSIGVGPDGSGSGTGSSIGVGRDGVPFHYLYEKLITRREYLYCRKIFLQINRRWIPGAPTGDTIAILDSGFDPTNDQIRNRTSRLFIAPLLTNIYNFIDQGEVPIDNQGHGSHVSTILNDTLEGNRNESLLHMKIIDGNGIGDLGCLMGGINRAIMNEVQYLNISGGFYAPRNFSGVAIIRYFISRFTNTGGKVFSSAGNVYSELNEEFEHYPSGLCLENDRVFEVYSKLEGIYGPAINNATDTSMYRTGQSTGLASFFERRTNVLTSYSNWRREYRNGIAASGLGFLHRSDSTSFYNSKFTAGTSFATPRAHGQCINDQFRGVSGYYGNNQTRNLPYII